MQYQRIECRSVFYPENAQHRPFGKRVSRQSIHGFGWHTDNLAFAQPFRRRRYICSDDCLHIAAKVRHAQGIKKQASLSLHTRTQWVAVVRRQAATFYLIFTRK